MTDFKQLDAVKIPELEIAKFCQRWKVRQFYLFGSVLRDDFTAESDIDVMVEFFPNASIGWKIVTMNDELETIFHRPVDLMTKKAIEESDNWLRRRNILDSVVLIYEQKEQRS
ncbi:MAG: nucleotidyltransferase domain-containing protein [Cyanobacteria bacterium J06621_8]